MKQSIHKHPADFMPLKEFTTKYMPKGLEFIYFFHI